ncbi:probable beta-1,3-galactosyltransferase 14 [Tanacetum coccineum]
MMQSMSMLVKTQDRKVAKTLKTNKDKDLKILEQKTKSKDNDKGSRSNITKHEGTSLQQDKDQNKDSRTKRQSNLNKSKELSDTEVGSNGLRLADLQSLNLLFTLVTDGGLGNLSKLLTLRSLNLDVRQIKDTGLASLRIESNDVASSSFRMFSNEDVTIGAWMLAMNVNHEDDRQLCQPGCTAKSVAVWDIPKCSGRKEDAGTSLTG